MESPKQRFIKQPEPDLKAIRLTLASEQMRNWCDVALLEFVSNQMPANDLATAACNQQRLEGARAYAVLLQTLADPVKKLEAPKATGVLEEIKQ